MSGKNGTHAGPAPTTYRVEVAGKLVFPDASGAAVAAQFQLLGLQAPTEIRVCPIYEITGKLSPRELELAAKELLSDPITQEYRIGDGAISPAFVVAPHWRVEVWLKPSVSDPHEASVRKGIADLGLPAPDKVRCGTVYKIVGRLPAAQIEKAAKKILSNPVIHRYVLAAP
ncbi:MAG: phosphoribosylformylglycinamidine synthase subunit PurS [Elusimicrobia bacterium]|nr:phosphoribosylformylglycinamidine synthase subunit PurS [Elusimicrobiota bacterium]